LLATGSGALYKAANDADFTNGAGACSWYGLCRPTMGLSVRAWRAGCNWCRRSLGRREIHQGL
jgi:hypothetical protein